MFNDFISVFFGNNYQPNDFDLCFALIFLMLIFHGVCALIGQLRGVNK